MGGLIWEGLILYGACNGGLGIVRNVPNPAPKVTEMGSIIGHRIDYNGVGALRGQRHIAIKN